MRTFAIALKLFLLLTIVTGVAYPLVMCGLAKLAFPFQAEGSLIQQNGAIVGSKLIAQGFDKDAYFWPRPSATSPNTYDPTASGGSNMGPTNPDFLKALQARVDDFKKKNPGEPVPTDLVTASGSGLDPDISPLAAEVQVPRVSKARGIPSDKVMALVKSFEKPRQFGVLGEPTVDVLELNLALDKGDAK